MVSNTSYDDAPVDQERWGLLWRPYLKGIQSVNDFFSKRNLWALSLVNNAISTNNALISHVLHFVMTSMLLFVTKMHQNNENTGGNISKGTYYVPPVFKDMEVLSTLKRKFNSIAKGFSLLELASTNLNISTQSATDLVGIPDSSIDYIFTDPPYSWKQQYGEVNFIWEAWLKLDSNWHEDEIIVNTFRGVSENKWALKMQEAISECFRVLKPGRYISLCYHDTSEGTWSLIQEIMENVGFIPDISDNVLSIDTDQKSWKQLVADKVNKRDLVLNFRKLKPGEVTRRIAITADEDDRTFNQKVISIIREFLNEHPGSTKDRIFDVLVSRLVRKGQMEAHDFEALLDQVAEPVVEPRMKDLFTPEQPNLFGTHEIKRWYLKDSEEGAEESDKAVADAAAKEIENFMTKQCATELQKSELVWGKLKEKTDKLYAKLEGISKEINSQNDAIALRAKRERSQIKRELATMEKEREKLKIQRSEWKQDALHYTYISEFYFPLQPKPRCHLGELLEDYFFFTEEGNWRPPANKEEKAEKQAKRAQAVRRKMQRYCTSLESGEPLPHDQHPEDGTIVEWIRYCKRVGLYAQGKILYEKSGLNLENLSEMDQVDVEEDYGICVRCLNRGL